MYGFIPTCLFLSCPRLNLLAGRLWECRLPGRHVWENTRKKTGESSEFFLSLVSYGACHNRGHCQEDDDVGDAEGAIESHHCPLGRLGGSPLLVVAAEFCPV